MCVLCPNCAQESLQRVQLGPVAQHAVAAMQRHTAEPGMAAAGLHLLLRLAGCPTCRTPISQEQQELLSVAGAVPAAVAALCTLSAAGAQPPAPKQAPAAAGDAPQLPTQQATQQAQQRALAISEGLQALHFMCAGHAASLGQLAAAGPSGGMQAVAAAMAAAPSEWPAEEHGLLLLAQLACREGAPVAEQQAAAVAIWQAAQAQVERRLVEVGRAAAWAMARLLQRLLAPGAQGAGSSLVPELLLQGTAVVLAMLQSCDMKVGRGLGVCGRGPWPVGGGGALRRVRGVPSRVQAGHHPVCRPCLWPLPRLGGQGMVHEARLEDFVLATSA